MATETLTLRLEGDVPLRDFAAAIDSFSRLVDALTSAVGEPSIVWTVADLEAGSGEITALGSGPDPEPLVRVRDAYLAVGGALAEHRPVSYAENIRKPAARIQGLLNGHITEALFLTSQADVIVRAAPMPPVAKRTPVITKGAVSGRVQTLTNRGSLRFTLYDLLHDRPVSCYLASGREEIMLDAWGRLAIVEGMVRRHPVSGQPIAIRDVAAVAIRPDPYQDAYRAARGAVPLPQSGLMPEDAIRRLRDA